MGEGGGTASCIMSAHSCAQSFAVVSERSFIGVLVPRFAATETHTDPRRSLTPDGTRSRLDSFRDTCVATPRRNPRDDAAPSTSIEIAFNQHRDK
jgi:hypothetical protein